MALSYDTLGGSITVEPSGAIPAGDLNTSVAIVGGYDDANADPSVTAGESTLVTSSTEAEQQFGANAELTKQTDLAIANGAGLIHGVPLSTTQTTESYTAASSGALSNSPLMDPRLTTADITVTDTVASSDMTVVMVDSSPTTSDVDSGEVAIHSRTGEWVANSSSDYDITYEYADYQTAIEAAVEKPVRYVIVCAEAGSVTDTLASELETQAADFRFKRGVVGVTDLIEDADVGTYTPSRDDIRVVEVAPKHGTNADGDPVRTMGAVGGRLATQPIDVSGSITYDELVGLDSLNVAYPPQVAQQFDHVTAITDTYRIAEGVTTASEEAFSDIYKTEIIDFIIERLHERIINYRGGSNARDSQRRFRSRLKRELSNQSAPNAQPPLLADGAGGRPYTLSVTQGDTQTEAEVTIGIDPAPIAKQVTVDVSVGPIRFNGVSV